MKEAILITVVLAAVVVGFFVMARLDKFLLKNRKSIKKEKETREPSRVVLTENLTDEEIIEEIKRFREKHSVTRIMLCDSDDNKLPESRESKR